MFSLPPGLTSLLFWHWFWGFFFFNRVRPGFSLPWVRHPLCRFMPGKPSYSQGNNPGIGCSHRHAGQRKAGSFALASAGALLLFIIKPLYLKDVSFSSLLPLPGE
jgi:hypothetical protein